MLTPEVQAQVEAHEAAAAEILKIMYPLWSWDDLEDTTATDDRKGS